MPHMLSRITVSQQTPHSGRSRQWRLLTARNCLVSSSYNRAPCYAPALIFCTATTWKECRCRMGSSKQLPSAFVPTNHAHLGTLLLECR
jgi:hypothetical protein